MKKQLEQYLAEINQFEVEKRVTAENSERKAWRVAFGLGIIATIAVLAVLVLTPLKEIRTEVVLLDKSTGSWDVPQRLEDVQISLDESFKKHFLTLYWTAKQSYSRSQAQMNFYNAAAFMSPKLQNDWNAKWEDGSKDNPITRYKQEIITVSLHSIVIPPKNDGTADVATIRYSTTKSGGVCIATVTFKLAAPPTDEKHRRINPVGFQVTEEKVDPETAGMRTSAVCE